MQSYIKTLALSLLVLCFQVSAIAQTETTTEAEVQADAPEENSGVEKITVTGSHIKRIQVEGPSPVQVLDRDSLEKSGYNSVSDALRDISANSFGSARESSGSNSSDTASVGLRGLGASRTLVLMNGRRLPRDPLTNAVDLNNVPFDAVERIEILKDGASALYGSDAVGGVVNIIMKSDFSGQSFVMNGSLNTEDLSERFEAGSQLNASYTHGISKDKFNVVGIFNVRRNERLFSSERDSQAGGISPTSDVPAFTNDEGASWTAPGCAPENVRSNGRCSFRFAEFSTELPTLEQYSLFLDGAYHLTPITDLVARASYVRKNVNYRFAPAPGTFATTNSPPNFPDRVAYRFVELGNRDTEIVTDSIFALLGIKTEVFSEWDFEFDVNFSQGERESNTVGNARQSSIEALVLSGGIDLSQPAGSRIIDQAGFDAARVSPFQGTTTSLLTVNSLISGALTDQLSLAFGVMYTLDDYKIESDAVSAADDVFGGGSTNGSGGDRTIYSVFSELSYLPFDNLELQLAARFDDFDDFGSTFNPKAAFRYQPTNKLMIRGSVGTGFKAPDLAELYGAQAQGFPFFVDAVACDASGDPNSQECGVNQYKVTTPSNPNLEEEEFISANLGTVYQINKDHSVGFDLFYIDMENVVSIDYEEITKLELAQGTAAFNANNEFGITVNRNAGGFIDDFGAGMVTPLLNLGKLRQLGIDLNTQHKFGFSDLGVLTLNSSVSYIFDYEEELFPGLGFESTLGEVGQPQWRAQLVSRFIPESLPLITTLTARLTGEHECGIATDCTLGTYLDFDLQTVYKTKSGDFSLGIRNIIDNPPLDTSSESSQLRDTLYSLRGRSVFFGYRYDI